MNRTPNFDDTQSTGLGEFLSAAQRPEGTMSYCECAGFLFTVACAPEMIPPSEWMSIIFNEQDAVYESMEQAQDILQSLMALYNEINRQVREADVHLPPSCNPRENPMDNLEEGAPLSQWSRGFMAGYDWLQELWDEYTPEELSEEMGAQLMVLSFFTNQKLAQAYLDEGERKDKSLEDMAVQILDYFPDAMTGFAHLGFSIQQVLQEHRAEQHLPVRSEKIGRNEPCPCGSGEKYKKCCGSTLH